MSGFSNDLDVNLDLDRYNTLLIFAYNKYTVSSPFTLILLHILFVNLSLIYSLPLIFVL